jgi:hypothetical protein
VHKRARPATVSHVRGNSLTSGQLAQDGARLPKADVNILSPDSGSPRTASIPAWSWTVRSDTAPSAWRHAEEPMA